MILHIENICRLATANIQVRGVTVLAGANGAGKSTVSKSLMTICSLSARIIEMTQFERWKSVFDVLRDQFEEKGGRIRLLGRGPGFDEWLLPQFWIDARQVVESLSANGGLRIFPKEFLRTPACVEAIENARPLILKALERPESDYVAHVAQTVFDTAFDCQLQPLFLDHAHSGISLSDGDVRVSVAFEDGQITQSELGRALFRSVTYFEPLNFLDFIGKNIVFGTDLDRYAGGSASDAVVASVPENLTLEDKRELDDAKRDLEEIVESLHGHLESDEGELRFKERFQRKEAFVNVRNLASGMKPLSAIVRAIENRSIRRGGLLIIDEPETNLHPEWQVLFAKFLVLLQAHLRISIVINTHSPYFLQALRKFSTLCDVTCALYLVRQSDDGDESLVDDVTQDAERVFSMMAAPFNNLVAD